MQPFSGTPPPPAGSIAVSPIGTIHSPFRSAAGTPIQPTTAAGAPGTVVLLPRFASALKDLEGFERVWLIYAFDRACEFRPEVVPFLDTRAHGLFATRLPARPNPLGLSAVRLIAVRGTTLEIADVDVLDGTPLLDLKPYVPRFDAFPSSRAGWADTAARPDTETADERFVPDQGDNS